VAPAKGAVPAFRPLGPPQPFRPIVGGQAAGGQQQIRPSIPGFPGAFHQQPASPPAADPSPDDQQARAVAPKAISDEQLTRNLLAEYADELLVDLKVWRVMPDGPSLEIGTLDHILASKARHATNYIDVQGEWVIDFYRSKDGKPLSKSKHVHTDGEPYYEGWKPHLIGGTMDNQAQMNTVAQFLKAMGIPMPTALVQQSAGAPGTIGVPTTVYNADVERMRDDLRELKQERTNLLTKLEAKNDALSAAMSEIATLKMRIEILASRPTETRGDSDIIVLAKTFADMGRKEPKDDSKEFWSQMMAQERAHSTALMELATRGKGNDQLEKIQNGWMTLFDGAQKMMKAGGTNETADIAKALAPLGVQWLQGQQQMQLEQMKLKAAHGTQQQPAPAAAASAAPDPNVQRIANKSQVFDATMGMILHRASTDAKPDDIGEELALAVRTVLYQELAEGHEQHQKMIRSLLENPVASLTEMAKNAGKDEAYASKVAERFMARFKELMGQAAPTPVAPAAVVPPPPPPADATVTPGPAATAAGPGSVASGDGKPEGAKAAVVAKGNGSPHHGDADGGGQAAGGEQGADHPDVAGQPS
jgi:hypothetical protein